MWEKKKDVESVKDLFFTSIYITIEIIKLFKLSKCHRNLTSGEAQSTDMQFNKVFSYSDGPQNLSTIGLKGEG